MAEKIMTLHPDETKKGVNFRWEKYDLMRETIVAVLNERKDLTFTLLGDQVNRRLDGRLEGSIGWYCTTVKLNLEARGILARVGLGSPQRIQLRVAKT